MSMTSNACSSQPLPRSSAEELGIPSSAISSFVEGLKKSGQEVHSFMLVRHGHVAAEAWWKPYAPELPHMLFSLSKSFTSTAVGIAVDEGRLTVEDPVLGFFPDDAPKRPSANLKAMRVRHLLSMSSGHEKDTLEALMTRKSRRWVKTILSLKVEREPGSLFVYNSGATYLLSAIVQKVTGQRLLDFLTPRLFDPLGIQGAVWEQCPAGIDTGGWGLSVKTEDIARLGLLYLHNGLWNGQRILSEAWVKEATRHQISNASENLDWAQGYGYQFWRCQHQAYRGDGAHGQFCIVMPELDAVLAMTSAAPNMQAILDGVWSALLPAMGETLKPIRTHQAALRRTVRSLRLDPPEFLDSPEQTQAVDGATYEMEANEAKMRTVSLSFAGQRLSLKIRSRRTTRYRCGAGKWVSRKVRRPETGTRALQPVRCAYMWTDAGELQVVIRAITTPFRETYTFRFTGDEIELSFETNVSWGPVLQKSIKGKRADPDISTDAHI